VSVAAAIIECMFDTLPLDPAAFSDADDAAVVAAIEDWARVEAAAGARRLAATPRPARPPRSPSRPPTPTAPHPTAAQPPTTQPAPIPTSQARRPRGDITLRLPKTDRCQASTGTGQVGTPRACENFLYCYRGDRGCAGRLGARGDQADRDQVAADDRDRRRGLAQWLTPLATKRNSGREIARQRAGVLSRG
jgi:hypothetical protein